MKRVTVKLFIEDPTTHAFVPVLAELVGSDGPTQVTAEGSVLVREAEFGTWRRVGTISAEALESVMRGEAREPWVK